MNMKFFVTAVLFGVFLSSCVSLPVPVIRLEPASSEGTWVKGTKYVKASNNDVVVIAGAPPSTEGISIYAEIYNISDHPILISPEFFYYMPKVEGALQVNAFDPEKKILEIDQYTSRERALRETQAANNLLFSTVGIAGEIASKKEEDKQSYQKSFDRVQNIENSQRERYLDTVESLSNNRSTWENKALRKQTLPPGKGVGGMIFFSAKHPEAPEIDFIFPFETDSVSIKFLQTAYLSPSSHQPAKKYSPKKEQ